MNSPVAQNDGHILRLNGISQKKRREADRRLDDVLEALDGVDLALGRLGVDQPFLEAIGFCNGLSAFEKKQHLGAILVAESASDIEPVFNAGGEVSLAFNAAYQLILNLRAAILKMGAYGRRSDGEPAFHSFEYDHGPLLDLGVFLPHVREAVDHLFGGFRNCLG